MKETILIKPETVDAFNSLYDQWGRHDLFRGYLFEVGETTHSDGYLHVEITVPKGGLAALFSFGQDLTCKIVKDSLREAGVL